MTDSADQPEPVTPPGAQWRSKKYIKLTDDEVLELSLKKLADKDLYFLIQELEYRNLSKTAAQAKTRATKKEMRSKSWWKYIPILFALSFLVKRMLESFSL
jgi:hypothetical protein